MNFHDVFTRVFTVEGAIAGGVFLLVALALVFALVRRRAGRGVMPSGKSERNRLEWVYVALLAGAAAFLVWFTVSANSQDTASAHPAAGPPPAKVSVTAFQWCWQFHYLDAPVTVTGTCTTDQYPTMVVPTGRPVEIDLTSRDVVHSFWIPDLDVKVDAYPDHTNAFDLTFAKPGQWLGRCAEYCGTYHTTMDFYVKAVSPEQYRQWLAQHGGQA